MFYVPDKQKQSYVSDNTTKHKEQSSFTWVYTEFRKESCLSDNTTKEHYP